MSVRAAAEKSLNNVMTGCIGCRTDGSGQVQDSVMGLVPISSDELALHIPAHAGACKARTIASCCRRRRRACHRYSWYSDHADIWFAFLCTRSYFLWLWTLLEEQRGDAEIRGRSHQHLLRSRASKHRCVANDAVWRKRQQWAGNEILQACSNCTHLSSFSSEPSELGLWFCFLL